jgi:4-hydroxy-tetrahydrodipicolinate reductase
MGGALVRCAARTEDIRVVAAVEQTGHPSAGRDAGEAAGVAAIGVPILAASDAAHRADVFIDFTFHTAVPAQARLAAELGKGLVVGTTALDEAETAAVRSAAQRVPVVLAPNMSLGVNLLFALVERAAATLGMGYRVEIDETHHIHKKDAPSGTALRLGEKAAAGRGQDPRSALAPDPKGPVAGDRIVIRSHREGEVVGEHTVAFSDPGETVELTHRAHSRDALAMGALHAARWVVGKSPGLYDMQDVLDLRMPSR